MGLHFIDGDGKLQSVSSTNPLPTFIEAGSTEPEAGNSSSTALASGATFTGTGVLNSQPDVMVSLQTDNSGMLYFDFSIDGINWSTFPVAGFSVSSGIHEFHTAVKGQRWFRIRFVNDTGTPTYMRLATYFGTYRASNTPLNQSIGLDTDGGSTRPSDFQDEVSRGLRSGVTPWTKFGYREGLTGSSGEQTIWATTGNHTILTSPSTYTIAFNDTTDGLGTTGATQLYFYHIDANGLPTITPHTLTGTSGETTAFTSLGINRCVVAASGSNNYNTNDITITATTGGTTQAIIPATQSVTQQAIFHNGANHIAIAKFLHIGVISVNKDRTVEIKGYVYNRSFSTRYEIFRTNIDTKVQLDKEYKDPIGFNLSPSDVLYFVADADGNDVSVDLRFSMNQYQQT